MGKKKLVFTKHALDRMKQRGVNLQDVEETIRRPNRMSKVKPDQSQEFERSVGNRTNFVVVQKIGKKLKVITTGWTK